MKDGIRNFIRFFAQRSTLANVFTFLMIFLGLSALMVMQRDNFPNVDFQAMTIITRFPGASAEDVELNVTNKLEEALKEVDGVDKVASISMENMSNIDVLLDRDYGDLDKVKTDVRDAVSRVGDLPREVDEDPLVQEITTSTAMPIIEVGLTGDIPYTELRKAASLVEKGLHHVLGVASLSKYGYLDREIKIEVAQDSAEKWGIPTHKIVEAIKNRNIHATGGSFESYTSEKNIVTLAQFSDFREVEDVIVHATSGGALIRVRDMAVVTDGFEPEKVRSRMNGHAAISFLVYKKESADMIRTVDAIKAFVADKAHRLPAGVSIQYSNDASRVVRNRLSVVITNGILGLVLVLVVLTVFLDLRSAFWVAMGIPVALLGTLFLLPVFGAMLSSIALAAMILVIGIVVDDGIVVAENISRHRELGAAPLDAVVEGTASVFHPVLTTVLTTGLAFAPMFFMSGMMGDIIKVIPLVVVLALAVSLVEINVALPAHLVGRVPNQSTAPRRKRARFFEDCRAAFGRFAGGALRFRYPLIGLFVMLLLLALWYAERYMDFTLFPTQSADSFNVLVELPSGASLDATSDKIKELETLLEGLPEGEIDSYVARIGSHGDSGENENWAFLGVYLTPFAERSRNADQIIEDIRLQAEALEGISNINFEIDSGGPPVGRPISISVLGSDDAMRNRLTALIVERLQAIEGVTDVDRDDKRGKDQIRLAIDYVSLADAGLTVADVARNVRLAYDGEVVTSVRYGNEDVDFRVILEQRARMSPEILADLVIPNPDGRFIRLAQVAEFLTEPGPLNIYHFDNERAITITGNIVKGLTTPMKATEQALVGVDLDRDWPGMRLFINGEAEETQTSLDSLFVGFIAAGVGVYLLLVVLFNSLVQPFIVMLAIPFGLIGVIVAFALHQQPLGFLAMLGVVGLTGLVVNDSLILVNLVNRLRIEEPAQTFRNIIIKATQGRLRSILITSITTVVGLLPMAYGIGGSDPFSAPMALAMGYGILFATPLTLVLLPCLLAVLDDASRLYERVYRVLAQRRTTVRLGEGQSETYLRRTMPSASSRQCETVSLTE